MAFLLAVHRTSSAWVLGQVQTPGLCPPGCTEPGQHCCHPTQRDRSPADRWGLGLCSDIWWLL